MTCRLALSLRDDFLDNELDPATAAELKSHLENCPVCREEFAETTRLRELLKSTHPAEPAAEYWPEVTSLILAKTTDGPSLAGRPRPERSSASDRREFARSALALAASICILFAALYLGSQHQRNAQRLNPPGAPVLITASLEGMVGDSDSAVMTQREFALLSGGRLLLGSPGPLGKGLGLVDLLTF